MNELCIFGLSFAIDSEVMVIGNTHVVQVNGLHKGIVSFISLWCLWHMHTHEVLCVLRTLNPNINRPIYTWKTLKPPHHFIYVSFFTYVYVFFSMCLHVFVTFSLCFYVSLYLSISISTFFWISIFFSISLCLFLPLFESRFTALHFSLYLFVSLFTPLSVYLFSFHISFSLKKHGQQEEHKIPSLTKERNGYTWQCIRYGIYKGPKNTIWIIKHLVHTYTDTSYVHHNMIFIPFKRSH